LRYPLDVLDGGEGSFDRDRSARISAMGSFVELEVVRNVSTGGGSGEERS
jgi:hypothetical protein